MRDILFSLRFIHSMVNSFTLCPNHVLGMDFSCDELLFPLALNDIARGRTCVLFHLLLYGEKHYKSQAVAVPVIPVVLDFSVTVLNSVTISVISAAGE